MGRKSYLYFIGLALFCFFAAVFVKKIVEKPSIDYTKILLAKENEIKNVSQGEAVHITVLIQNNNSIPLDENTMLSYHLLQQDGTVVDYDGVRCPFGTNIVNGESCNVEVTIPGIKDIGDYVINFDLVIDGVMWYSEKGTACASCPVRVEALCARMIPNDFMSATKAISTVNDKDDTVNQTWRLIENALKCNENEITLQNVTYRGFTAGGSYPQFWVRDNNTIMYGSRFFSNQEFLRDWIELHLLKQASDGNINDWVDGEGATDKNTVETDQETSLIQAAYKYVVWTGDTDWLGENTNGECVINRLENAMRYLINNHTDVDTGLLYGAHTIDWGDVEIGEETQEAIYLDENSALTVDIYDNAMFVLAAKNLSELYQMIDDAERAQYWDEIAAQYANSTRKELWMSNRGYFRICKHITNYQHEFEEDEIFGMGGNSMAILSGIADEEMSEDIFKVAVDRQKEYNVSTISGSVLPAYPDNTFSHPIVTKAYTYQNGGQWDWFGGRLISAMYMYDSELANKKLLEITQKVSCNGCINEWETLDGTPSGSENYAGAAGVLADAIVSGRYGVHWSKEQLIIAPSYGFDGGSIALVDSATGNRLWYSYDVSDDLISLNYMTDYPREVCLQITYDGKKSIDIVRVDDKEFDKYNVKNGLKTNSLVMCLNNDTGAINVQLK